MIWAKPLVDAWKVRRASMMKESGEKTSPAHLVLFNIERTVNGKNAKATESWMFGQEFNLQGFFYMCAVYEEEEEHPRIDDMDDPPDQRLAEPVLTDQLALWRDPQLDVGVPVNAWTTNEHRSLNKKVVRMTEPRVLKSLIELLSMLHADAERDGKAGFEVHEVDYGREDGCGMRGVIEGPPERLAIAYSEPKLDNAIEDDPARLIEQYLEDGLVDTDSDEEERTGLTKDDVEAEQKLMREQAEKAKQILKKKVTSKDPARAQKQVEEVEGKAKQYMATDDDLRGVDDVVRDIAVAHAMGKNIGGGGGRTGASAGKDGDADDGEHQNEDESEETLGEIEVSAEESAALFKEWDEKAALADQILRDRHNAVRDLEVEGNRGFGGLGRFRNLSLVEICDEEEDDAGEVERVVAVELVDWDIAKNSGRVVPIRNKKVMAPVFDWQKSGLYRARDVFAEHAHCIVHPNVGVSLSGSAQPVPEAILKLREMWEVAVSGAEYLTDDDCRLCCLKHEASRSSDDESFRKKLRKGAYVIRCPFCLLAWHDQCAAAARKTADEKVHERSWKLAYQSLPDQIKLGLCRLCRRGADSDSTTTKDTKKRRFVKIHSSAHSKPGKKAKPASGTGTGA
jgi:hypothetical protein